MNRDRIIVGGVFIALLLLAQKTTALGNDFFSLTTLFYILALVPSIVLHEVSHGWLADKYGDPTARNANRLTLNPVAHVDPVGTVVVPLVLLLLGAPVFGWAKPVPVAVSGMSRNRQMFVGLIGPATNALLSLAGLLMLIGAVQLFSLDAVTLLEAIVVFAMVNVALAVFNMIPVPPLDGSSVIERLIPVRALPKYFRFRDKSIWIAMILFIVLQMQFGIIGKVIRPFQELWLSAATSFVG